ncbi:ABC transporter ATP-binding protein [Amycolatopsis sp. DSM 110486]|uniref:ABC transporter ATP-binding protein n=1 Tax=Amycolatopsis sp. DSM 110486 TaxID=2865832 RepID=UPI001C69876D|nr:ABC transporter ATP-binding protein [Amycolatopsis sp. DSM 110486]QYN18988.1 ABC transporter ATP-binding protein [Amycolatopsis sp. DSM 110486]
MRLQTQSVDLAYTDRMIASNLSLQIPDGQVSVLIGPNGCGKSTAMRALARLLPPKSGQVVLDGKSIHHMPTKEVARKLAILPQVLTAPEGISIEDLVWFGRHPHRTSLKVPTEKDREAVEWALAVTRVAEIRDAHVDQLSGGQRQRVWIAVCLAQETEILLLDEPTTYLDVAYQLEVLDLLADLNRDHGTTIAMVLHDFNMAAEYADHVFVMSSGTLVTEGSPREVFTQHLIQEVFGVESHVMDHPVSGKPLCIPVRGERRSQRAPGRAMVQGTC